MKEELLKVIEKVKMLSEKYPEFKDEMERLFAKPDPITEEKISKILSYLGLDVCVDHLESIIDYSFIEEKNVRDKLISDNREMIRYRYGTRYHDIIFDEYCRYAQFQIEMLFNYYYSKTDNNNIDEIKNHLKIYNDDGYHNKIDAARSLPAISFINKVWAFANEFQKKDIIDPLDYLSRVRNSQSHRGPEERESVISNIQKIIEDYKIKLLPDGAIDFNALNENLVKKNLYETKIKRQYKDYLFELWHKRQPYDNIKETIDTIANIIREKLEEQKRT